MIKKRYAFTMLELIFVIVIMGILGKYGVEFLARAYDNFIFSKINNDLQARSEASVEFITKRLEHRIKASTRAINTVTATWDYTSDTIGDNNATVLEWIASDDEDFRGGTAPLWSGVIDINTTTSSATALVSPESNFTYVDNNISVLSNGTSGLNDSVIYFVTSPVVPEVGDPQGFYANISASGSQNHTLHPIQLTTTPNTLAPLTGNFSGIAVYEYYKLSWTANAVVLEDYNTSTNLGNLYFYYNYQPWQGEDYNTNGTRVLLAKDISAFRFRSAGTLIKIQVCAKSDLTEEYALCKEKSVF
jgi:prepilin-type N-terminal cleavage/methylation domain-containing protein